MKAISDKSHPVAITGDNATIFSTWIEARKIVRILLE